MRSSDETDYLQYLVKRYTDWWKPFALPEINRSTFHEIPIKLKADNSGSIDARAVLKSILIDGTKNQVLITGDPGSGKSSLMVRLLLMAAQNALDDPSAHIPVLIDAGLVDDLQQHERSDVTHWIKTSLRDNDLLLGLPEQEKLSYAEKLILNDEILVLIDGVNEMPRWAISAIKDFCERGCPMVVTTRNVSSGTLGIDRVLSIQLPDGQTPLTSWMLHFVNMKADKVPNTIGAAMREFIYRYSAAKFLDTYETRGSLVKLAYAMIRLGRPLFEYEACTVIGSEKTLNYLLCHHLIQWSGTPGSRKIEFCHQLIQDYYAAEYLLDCSYSDPSHDIIQQMTQPEWRNAIELFKGFAEVVGRFGS